MSRPTRPKRRRPCRTSRNAAGRRSSSASPTASPCRPCSRRTGSSILKQLRLLARAGTLHLAHEEEIATLYPECEVGAMPPFGAVYGQRVFVDRCLVGEPEMVFNAGTHTEAICMHYGDFAELAKPVVGAFGRLPVHRAEVAPRAPRRRPVHRVLSPMTWRGVMKSRPPFPGIRVTANGNQLVSYHTETRIADAGVFYPITPSTEGGELYPAGVRRGQAERLRPQHDRGRGRRRARRPGRRHRALGLRQARRQLHVGPGRRLRRRAVLPRARQVLDDGARSGRARAHQARAERALRARRRLRRARHGLDHRLRQGRAAGGRPGADPAARDRAQPDARA